MGADAGAAAPGTVRVERDGAVATLVLSQPRRLNALSLAMWRGVAAAMRELEADDAARVVVIRGEGHEAFSSGADISEFEALRSTRDAARVYNTAVHEAMETVAGAAKPVLAMVFGVCIGGGCELAICADLRLAADNAWFAIPAARMAIPVAPADVRRLTQLVGPTHAKEALLTARRIRAERALAIGLANEVHPAAELEGATYQLAHEIAALAPGSLAWSKRLVNQVMIDSTFGGAEAALDEAQHGFYASQDFAEAVRARAERRPPRFTGR